VKTYFLVIRAKPVPGNPNFRVVPRVSAHFWVVERSPEGATRRAMHYLKSQGWNPGGVEQEAILSGPAMHAWSENETAGYRRARNFGISMFLK
jgi:hypothetical protein